MTVLADKGTVLPVSYGDQKFRHGLRNIRNSLGLALRAYDICDVTERLELLEMIGQTADEAIAMIDSNLPEEFGGTEMANG